MDMLTVPHLEIQQNVRSLIEKYRIQNIRNIMRRCPELFYQRHLEIWKKLDQLSSAINVKGFNLGSLISKCPLITKADPEQLKQLISIFEHHEFSLNELLDIVEMLPEVLDTYPNEQELNLRIEFCKSWGLKGEILKCAIHSCPQFLLDKDWKSALQEKIFYCQHKLLLTRQDLRQNFQTILTRDFDEVIGPRSEFMLRQGSVQVQCRWWQFDVFWFVQNIANCHLQEFEEFFELEWETQLCQEIHKSIRLRMNSKK
eukprot:TRINITY_DN1746_c1_g1_i3.p2 TRINITY_DN1746_c1_g1~~TRINITY_DN1746_c1_g1_i3.p2  ORF type:complete len:257 (-),score=3.81 TRINITY_DN1746_c1_g1_i3:307-1077(-)